MKTTDNAEKPSSSPAKSCLPSLLRPVTAPASALGKSGSLAGRNEKPSYPANYLGSAIRRQSPQPFRTCIPAIGLFSVAAMEVKRLSTQTIQASLFPDAIPDRDRPVYASDFRPDSRTDIHRPSAILPADYEWVAFEYLRVDDLGAALWLQENRRTIAAHMARTGGQYSGHQHGGNCMVCGSPNAVYTVLFYHSKSNTYIRMGQDCAQKCDMGRDQEFNAFRAKIDNAREAQAGKRKAAALLADQGLSRCWDIYLYDVNTVWPTPTRIPYEESTIRDIVSRLVQYGGISDRQFSFLHVLLGKIDSRADRERSQAESKAQAADCPTGPARMTIEGTVLTVRVDDTPYGSVTKTLIQHSSGFKLWGTRPSGTNWDRGDRVRFDAMVTRSDKDSKFGFYSRPTKASILNANV